MMFLFELNTINRMRCADRFDVRNDKGEMSQYSMHAERDIRIVMVTIFAMIPIETLIILLEIFI